ncbi:MAG: hypothetical protein U0T73_13260 [Chitinophagales bacterium]
MNRIFCLLALTAGMLLLENCSSSSKIPCPTYKDSLPEKTHHGKPGSQKPPKQEKISKPKSGVLPTDGSGKRMHHTN